MGGDHKCPVCQATFTRPQHVTRHMRSHTGDRPYKCQHCGDQFARSDLLSRHVNKCHGGEKDSTAVPSTRRKGGASRATTSKQACDQCVEKSLACDGSNPCTKCVQRKVRCTFVKFARQTAPIGPGHNPSKQSQSPYSSFPSLSSMSTASSSSLASFPSHGSIGLSAIPPLSAPAAPLLGQSGLAYGYTPQNSLGDEILLGSNESRIPNIAAYGQVGYPNYQVGADGRGYQSDIGDPHKYMDGDREWWSEGEVFYRGGGIGMGDESDSAPSGPSSAASSNVHLPLHEQPYLLDGTQGFNQPPHISPPPPHQTTRISPPSQSISPLPPANQSISPVPPSQLPHFAAGQQGQNLELPRPGTSAGFSNAFGLLSLDDPDMLGANGEEPEGFFENLVAGINGDNAVAGDPNVTPMPRFTSEAGMLPGPGTNPHQNQNNSPTKRPSSSSGHQQHLFPGSHQFALKTPRDQETRELKEFWEQFIRTPLTGAPLGLPTKTPQPKDAMNPFDTNAHPGGNLGIVSPGYRRQRVSSLPSVKTPLDESLKKFYAAYNGMGYYPNGNPNVANQDHQFHPPANPNTQQHADHPSHPAHAPQQPEEDLRSYEAAVLARSPPTTLNLPPGVRGKMNPGTGSGHSSPNASKVTFASGVAPGQAAGNAMMKMRSSPSSPGKRRPSFKRLASQPLEGGVRKRGRGDDGSDDDGDDEDGDDDDDDDDDDAVFEDEVARHGHSMNGIVVNGVGRAGST